MAKADKEKNMVQFFKLDDHIDAALLEARRLFISDAVDHETAEDIIRKLWYLELQDPKKPITFVINSPGGSVDSGFAIWDQVKMISSPVMVPPRNCSALMTEAIISPDMSPPSCS